MAAMYSALAFVSPSHLVHWKERLPLDNAFLSFPYGHRTLEIPCSAMLTALVLSLTLDLTAVVIIKIQARQKIITHLHPFAEIA
jgi:hypothetical protein